MSIDIIQQEAYCVGCRCGEVISARNPTRYGAKQADDLLGFREVRVSVGRYVYTPKLCIRCQNKLTRLDHLRLAIVHHIQKMGYNSVKANELASLFDEYTACRTNLISFTSTGVMTND